MHEPGILTVKLLGLLFISAFIPASAYTFFKFRLRKKEAEFQRALSLMGLRSQSFDLLPSVRAEFVKGDYVLPVSFCFVMVMLTMGLLLFGNHLVESVAGVHKNLLFSLGDAAEGAEHVHTRARHNLTVVTTAMLGAYIWSSQNIIRRLVTADLSPGAYYQCGTRMIVAGMVALMVSLLLTAEATREYMVVVSFLIGFFPDRGIRFLIDKVRMMQPRPSEHSHPLPLDMIEGISQFHKERLGEVGIDNAQNLAETTLVLLMIRTPFQARKLLDWVGQAKLLLYLKQDFYRITNNGVRTIFDLMEAGQQPGFLEALADEAKVSELKLKTTYQLASNDSGLKKLGEFQDRLTLLDEYGAKAEAPTEDSGRDR